MDEACRAPPASLPVVPSITSTGARKGMALMLASEFVTGIPDVSTPEWEGSRNY
jgi:hypothetical protein